ncbi:uncharacterized protein LOC27208608 [Drosophila simulans]|uniref:MADF domain-containing protein n=1 Tax=Drosophila simulans TaxID=7240 RepID=A0A0J9RS98_DROSI|nr:uncharacterized protein LOC27208608 [Drosophila simulans]XP_039149262.1 uncharacterized protein LOC27208608 [Drosophila simulans]KMY98648.1 uncharacterized protein Dsimw501_GD28763 [Drosophila simulans]
MDGFDALLIASVKRNVSIFEKYHSRYDRKQAWIAVAQACQRSVEHCQVRWKSLRDRYVREAQRPAATRRYFRMFKELDFLREHMRIRRKQNELCNTLNTNTTPVPGETVESQSADEPALQRNYITEFQPDELIVECKGEEEYLSETDNSNAEFISEDSACHIEQSSSSSNGEGQSQTQAKFMSVMNLIESVLQDKPAEPQDPFYTYLESILAGVDDSTRRDIQLKVLNFVSDEIRGSRQN